MRYWWVNQNQTFEQEQTGGYLWSPKRNSNGVRNQFYSNMRAISPGDLVLSFRRQHICSVGFVRSFCYESPKPEEFGSTGLNWSQIGWRVDVKWTQLQNQIRPRDHIEAIRPVLPERYSPLQHSNGHGLQSVYLAAVPAKLMEVLAGIVGYEMKVILGRPLPPPSELISERADEVEQLKTNWENYIEKDLENNKELPETDRIALVNSRRGQGLFRRNLRKVESSCRITGVENPEHLIASHCKPWRHSDNRERLDGENGLLLTPTIDHLFDRGFISFENNGLLLVSPVADREALFRMGIDGSCQLNVGAFSSGQKGYLGYHREDIFLES